MKTLTSVMVLLVLLVSVALIGCGSQEVTEEAATVVAEVPAATTTQPAPLPTATPLSEPLYGLANLESLEILDQGSTSDEITVRLRGVLPNGCTTIDETVTDLDGNVFTVAMITVQSPGRECTEAEVPFEEIITLDVSELPGGSYTVRANDLRGSFSLETVEEPVEEAVVTPASPVSTSISGRVWHDLCAIAAVEGVEPSSGCVATEDDDFQANGLWEDEPGIEGVRISIGTGECPAEAVDTVMTGADGEFIVEDLEPGTYCVFVDVVDENNQEILLPGTWTAPVSGVPEFTIAVAEGETPGSLDFGWDYQFLPIAEVDPATCVNSFEFVEDLNIPDDTVYPPGAEFTKRWRLRNNGTCPWFENYSITFVGGDQISAQTSYSLTRPVAPGQDLEVAIDLVAPSEPGTYRANWQVARPDGEPFGINGIIEDAFWLQIVVEENATPLATPSPDLAVIGGVVWDDFCLNSDPGQGCVEVPEGSGNFIGDATLNPGESRLSGITISLAEGACPADGSLPPAATILETTVTDQNGLYRFENLSDGTYCIFMDALSEANVDLLIPGNWTWPASGVGRYGFILDPGEQALELDFGWDFQD